MKRIITPISVSVHSEGENPIFGELATHVLIDDDAAGPYIVLKQTRDDLEPGTLKLDLDELKTITKIAEEMIAAYPKDKA